MDVFVWGGVALCLLNSGLFSGLTLGLMGPGRLRLEAEARGGSTAAATVLELRRDPNRLLTTLLWGNVGVNVLLTLLTDSVLTGVGAFVFSTFGITLIGEIAPQAYFSRNAVRTGALLAPLVRFYLVALYPFAKPTAMLLDRWLGPEAILYYRERDLRELLELHAAAKTDVSRAEAQGALNFLELDDIPVVREGEPIHPESVLPVDDSCRLPAFERSAQDPFIRSLQASRKKWVVLVGRDGEPGLVIDADGFLRGALLEGNGFAPNAYCHRPILVRDASTRLGDLLTQFRVERPEGPEDDVVDWDLVLLWTAGEKRVVTGADILGRLLRGIARRAP